MNVYPCLYRGIFGYGCRLQGAKWMFVPELGQSDNHIHKDLSLHELLFKNPFDKKYEAKREQELKSYNVRKFLRSLLFPPSKSVTVGGLLFVRD